VPTPSDRFEHGDILVLLGTEDAIASFQGERAHPVEAGS
jgi:K+/H+ antiporter YhaU regulatory subunit KhtT